MDRHIALTGFMAAGKSSVGRRLAAELDLPFVDTDDAIVAEHGPITGLFARVAESGFREIELEAVRTALAGPCAVLALGGGAVTHASTRALLSERALRVFLDVPLDIVMARLRNASASRPMLGPAPAEARVRALWEARLPLYREADLIVDCGRRSSSSIAKRVADLLRSRNALLAP